MMSFLYPLFLAGAAAVALPIVLHLLRRDVAPEQPFAAVRLLKRVPIEQTRKRRLRDLLLLAARITALLLLAAAFARPYLVRAEPGTPLRIVAVDRSFSMAAPGRFAAAMALAREAVDGAGRSRVAVIAFDDRADVLAGGGSADEARAALNRLQPAYGSTRFAAMIARAAEIAGDAPAHLVVISDLQRIGWEETPVEVPASLTVEPRVVEQGTGTNAAVADARLDGGGVTALIRNEAPAPLAGTARLTVDGAAVASSPFVARPGEDTPVRFAYRAPERAAVAVEIEDGRGYPADDRRFLLTDPTRPRVLVVTGDAEGSGFYVARALQAGGGPAALDVRVRPASSVGAMTPDEAAGCRAVVLLSTRRLDRRGRDLLARIVRSGAGILVVGSDDVDPAAAGAMMEWAAFGATERAADRTLAATDLRHPVFRAFGALAANLGQVRFSRAWTVNDDGAEVAARFTDGSPALLERQGAVRAMVFASDLDNRWNDFPLHPAFVPFASEAVRHVAGEGAGRREYLVADAPAGVRPVPGAYALGEDGRRIVVNVDPRESSTAVMRPDEFTAMLMPASRPRAAVASRRAEALEARQNLWRYGLMLMLATLVAESVVGRAH